MINFMACPYPDLAPVFSLVKYVLSLVAVIIPIILIVLGIIDFSKAVMAKDESEIKKNQSIFIKRVIYAVAIFFVYTLVVFITNLVDEYFEDSGATNWMDCFEKQETSTERAEKYCKTYSGVEKQSCINCYLNNKFNASWHSYGDGKGECDTSVMFE